MVLKISKTYWLPKLKSQWIKLYSANTNLSAFQAYDFVLRFWRNYYVYCIRRREIPVFYLIEEEGEPRFIAPLCKKADGTYVIFGSENGCEYCDFIYAIDADVHRYVSVLMLKIKAPIVFQRVRESSKLYEACKRISGFRQGPSIVNVNIALPERHTDYIKSLSKSMRQNIRTAYNRLNKDGHKLSLVILHGNNACSYSYDFVSQCMVANEMGGGKYLTKDEYMGVMLQLYYKRHEQRYNVQTSAIKKWYLEHLNFVTVSLRQLENAMSVMLFIDGELAAFMGGFVSKGDGTYVVPRLSINEEFGFYSPGVLLVNETARFMIEHTPYRNLDLSQGTESYKYNMGGVEHLTQFFILRANCFDRGRDV